MPASLALLFERVGGERDDRRARKALSRTSGVLNSQNQAAALHATIPSTSNRIDSRWKHAVRAGHGAPHADRTRGEDTMADSSARFVALAHSAWRILKRGKSDQRRSASQ